MEKIIRVESLCKKYEDFTAVDRVSFDIYKGEIFGFLGPNGAGKTTTINMLIGMAHITSGKIFYQDQDLTKKLKDAQKLIGIVADESNLYGEMTGFDNLSFCGSLYGMRKAEREERADELLELFGLSEFKKRKFQAYSKGMKRKLTIAAALMHRPEILFLDEPTTGIDIGSVRQIRELIKSLNKNGTTIFLTTHYIEEAERLCDRIAFIKEGEIIKLDSVDNLLTKTKNQKKIEIRFEAKKFNHDILSEELEATFPQANFRIINNDAVEFICPHTVDIVPIINFFASHQFNVLEAKVIKPSLEDVFVEITGIGTNMMKKEKEKK